MNLKILSLTAILISGCQAMPASQPPICDGRHRRPANPAVSIADAPAGADLKSLKPCGGRP